MKRASYLLRNVNRSLCALLLLCVATVSTTLAGTLNLTTVPLATATTTVVKPNLMFILDNSGSMNWDYMPDWVVDGQYCKGTGTGTSQHCCRNSSGSYITSSSRTSTCLPSTYRSDLRGMPPFYSSDFNRGYYDPATTYLPPKNYDGLDKTSYDGNSNVPLDAYGKQTTSTLNLKTSYPDVEWCTDTSYTDCLRNDNYLLPGTVNGKSYTIMNATTASGTKKFSAGTVAAPEESLSRAVGPFYYVMVPGEYCTDSKQTDCQAATAPDASYQVVSKLRWCRYRDLTECQATQNSTYQYPRYPTVVLTEGIAASKSSGRISVNWVNDCNTNRRNQTQTTVSSIKLNGVEMLTDPVVSCQTNNSGNTRKRNLARDIAENIGNGFTVSRNDNVLTITAPDGSYNGIRPTYSINNGSLGTEEFDGGSNDSTPAVAVPGAFKRIDIVPGETYSNVVVDGQIIVNRVNRSDCTKNGDGTRTCTYDQELKNFANWFAWYRTRMQMMKSSVSHAFQNIDNRYRVGFYAINRETENFLDVDTFEAGSNQQKDLWYGKLFNAYPDSGTPLRSSLANVGRLFAGKDPLGNGAKDPIQYSCQQNFSILTTDGYWNTDGSSDVKKIGGEAIGNMDGNEAESPRPMYEGPTASSGSLADVAKYYYDTDLRSSALGNCEGVLEDGTDVCENNVFTSGTDNNVQQHMSTFTLGLGIDGTVQYQKDYKTATLGDFYNIKTGAGSPSNWPVPQQERAEAIDDLWHAAVNGRGTYYSAKNSDELSQGLNDALASIGMRRGAGAAAATSSLNPVAGDNFAYVASYTTLKWTGNLEARSINLTTGEVSENASWCLEDVVAGVCAAPSEIVQDTSGDSNEYFCSTPGATEATCTAGQLDEDNNCLVQIATSCTGKMQSMVGAYTDTRTIKTADRANGVLTDFAYDNLSSTQKTYFGTTNLTQLSQWPSLTTTQREAAAGANFVNYLRGQFGYENRDSNSVEENRLFRYREAVIGDAMESEPSYVGKPAFSYVDSGYAAFATSQANRGKTVYLGTNDGMLHAFDATNGTERWAYVPSMVIPNLWKLADLNYASMHTNYVNGSPKIADIKVGDDWKTILISGLNGGGRGYFALDVTDPVSPSFLWEIDTSTDEDIGYSYGEPIITKKQDGTWVVLFASGYNNVSPGDGEGHLYIYNAWTGTAIDKIDTGVGSTATPSGLAKISGWADDPMKNNTTTYVYGGDLAGNVWKFDINATDAGDKVMKFAILKDASGNTQPVTVSPELGLIGTKKVIFVATGKYLEAADLTDMQTQSLYAIKDEESGSVVNNPRSVLVAQTITASGTTATRTGDDNGVDFTSGLGWYIDFPDNGERAHIDPKLDAGVLFVPTTVPSNTVCAPGGYSWLNYFDYKTGWAVLGDVVSQKYDGPIVGINVYYTPDGKRHVAAVTANNPTPTKPPEEIPSLSTLSVFKGRRAIWREIFP